MQQLIKVAEAWCAAATIQRKLGEDNSFKRATAAESPRCTVHDSNSTYRKGREQLKNATTVQGSRSTAHSSGSTIYKRQEGQKWQNAMAAQRSRSTMHSSSTTIQKKKAAAGGIAC